MFLHYSDVNLLHICTYRLPYCGSHRTTCLAYMRAGMSYVCIGQQNCRLTARICEHGILMCTQYGDTCIALRQVHHTLRLLARLRWWWWFRNPCSITQMVLCRNLQSVPLNCQTEPTNYFCTSEISNILLGTNTQSLWCATMTPPRTLKFQTAPQSSQCCVSDEHVIDVEYSVHRKRAKHRSKGRSMSQIRIPQYGFLNFPAYYYLFIIIDVRSVLHAHCTTISRVLCTKELHSKLTKTNLHIIAVQLSKQQIFCAIGWWSCWFCMPKRVCSTHIPTPWSGVLLPNCDLLQMAYLPLKWMLKSALCTSRATEHLIHSTGSWAHWHTPTYEIL